MARRYVLLLVLLASGVGADQASKAWANTRLATDEHPLLLAVEPDDEGKTVAQLAAEEYGVPPDELEALVRSGYRPIMRFNPHARVEPHERVFGVSPVTGFRGFSYWVFCAESLDVAPRRYPRAAAVVEDAVAFNGATVGDYIKATLSVAFGEERTARIAEKYVYAVDYTRVLPDDVVAVGDRFLLTERTVPVIPGFAQLRYAENPGAAWGFLGALSPGVRRTFFQVVTWLALAVMAALIHRLRHDQVLPLWALGLIMAGAIGNFADRLRFNYVIDFVDFWAFGMHWPTFNVADVLISGGALLLAGEAVLRRDHSYLLGRHPRPAPLTRPARRRRTARPRMHGTFVIFGIDFPAYFTLLMIGFLVGIYITWKHAPAARINPNIVLDFGILVVMGGVGGGRLAHVLFDGQMTDYYYLCADPMKTTGELLPTATPSPCTTDEQCVNANVGQLCNKEKGTCHSERDCLRVFKFWYGGLTYYGGFLVAIPLGIWYLRKHRVNPWRFGDLAAFAVPLGIGFGRLGCFFAGCCFGGVCDLPWA